MAKARRQVNYDLWALIACFGGAALALVIAMGSSASGGSTSVAFWVFVVTQIAAVTLGLLAWRSPRGKAAAVTATVLILLAIMLVS